MPIYLRLPRRIGKKPQRQFVWSRHLGGESLDLRVPTLHANIGMRRAFDRHLAGVLVDRRWIRTGWCVLIRSLVSSSDIHVVLHLTQVGGCIPPRSLRAMPSHSDDDERQHAHGGAHRRTPQTCCHKEHKDHAEAEKPSPRELHKLHLWQDPP